MTRDVAPDYSLASGFTVPGRFRDALVQTLDGSEELVDSCGLAGYFMGGQVRRYCFVELGGPANALSNEQLEHCLRIVLLQSALLPLLNCAGGFA